MTTPIARTPAGQWLEMAASGYGGLRGLLLLLAVFFQSTPSLYVGTEQFLPLFRPANAGKKIDETDFIVLAGRNKSSLSWYSKSYGLFLSMNVSDLSSVRRAWRICMSPQGGKPSGVRNGNLGFRCVLDGP